MVLLTKMETTLCGSVMPSGAHIVITLAPSFSSFRNRLVRASTKSESLNQNSKTVASEISAYVLIYYVSIFDVGNVPASIVSYSFINLYTDRFLDTKFFWPRIATALPSPQPRWQNISLFFNLAKLNIFLTTLSVSETLSPTEH